ncbi:hypothetical protein IAT40_002211 [Kwoniella sp. CBS 6097]
MLICIPPHLRDEVCSPRHDLALAPKRRSIEKSRSRIGICGEGRGRGGQRGFALLPTKKPTTSNPETAYTTTAASKYGGSLDEKRAAGYGIELSPDYTRSEGLSEKQQNGYLPPPATQRNSTSQARRRKLLSTRCRWLACLFSPLLLILHLFHPTLSPISSLTSWTGTGISTSTSSPAPLDETYVEHCHALLGAPPNGTYTTRLQAIAQVLDERSVYITEPGPSAEYYLGAFSKEDWNLSERPFLIAIPAPSSSAAAASGAVEAGDGNGDGGEDVILLTPAFEALRASLIPLPAEIKSRVRWVEWREDQSPYAVLADYLTLKGVGSFVLDDGVRQSIARGLAGILDEVAGDVVTEVGKLRERKSSWEIEMLQCANTFTLHAIRQTKDRMHIGITESQTAKILEEEMAKTGLVGGEALILFGENAALPHGSGTDRKLGKKDMILIDAGGKWGGYVSDITRTFALPSSKIPRSHIDLWEAVRKAQMAPYTLLHSSTSGPTLLQFSDLDKAARAIVSLWKAGIPVSEPTLPEIVQASLLTEDEPDFSIFTHRLGHGIGLEGHESPYLVQGPQGARTPQVGNVFSLEPGVYLPADGPEVNGLKGIGVRLEDCFVITGQEENGAWKGEWLSGPVEKWGDI